MTAAMLAVLALTCCALVRATARAHHRAERWRRIAERADRRAAGWRRIAERARVDQLAEVDDADRLIDLALTRKAHEYLRQMEER